MIYVVERVFLIFFIAVNHDFLTFLLWGRQTEFWPHLSIIIYAQKKTFYRTIYSKYNQYTNGMMTDIYEYNNNIVLCHYFGFECIRRKHDKFLIESLVISLDSIKFRWSMSNKFISLFWLLIFWHFSFNFGGTTPEYYQVESKHTKRQFFIN